MPHAHNLTTMPSHTLRTGMLPRARWMITVGVVGVLALTGCSMSPTADGTNAGASAEDQVETPENEPAPEPAEGDKGQEETCDWDSPKISGAAEAPDGQAGELETVLIGSWQHTHTSEGGGFEEVTNDHRFVFPSPERMLYCQHVPGATDHAENAADVTLHGTKIELPGGKYGYTVTAWSEDTMLWDNPVGGGYVYLLQRR